MHVARMAVTVVPANGASRSRTSRARATSPSSIAAAPCSHIALGQLTSRSTRAGRAGSARCCLGRRAVAADRLDQRQAALPDPRDVRLRRRRAHVTRARPRRTPRARATIERTPACARSTRSMFGIDAAVAVRDQLGPQRVGGLRASPSRSANAARHASGYHMCAGIRSRSRERRVARDLGLGQLALAGVDEVDDQPVAALELRQPVARGDRHRHQLLADRAPLREVVGVPARHPLRVQRGRERGRIAEPAGDRDRLVRERRAPRPGRRRSSVSIASRASSARPQRLVARRRERLLEQRHLLRGRRRGSRRRARTGRAPPARARRRRPRRAPGSAACAEHRAADLGLPRAHQRVAVRAAAAAAACAGSTSIARAKWAAAVS